uniref:Peroxidase n=1 Tax=Salix viminalis TaxID=40686 RepID=A0A6N2M314_SALVM
MNTIAEPVQGAGVDDKNLSRASLHRFIHQDFHEAVDRMTIIDAFLFLIVHSIDKLGIWHRLPVFLGLLYLAVRRHLHQEYNLFNVGRTPTGVRYNPADYPYRTADGKYNEPFNEGAGSQGTFFGRNILPVNQKDMKPDPMVVATKLLARKKFIDTGKQFNMIAASWIQFMIHDWIDHMEETQQIELVAPKEVANQCPLKSFKDGSAIYGSNEKTLHKVRTFKDGKLKISEDGLLLHDQDGIAVSGDVRNSWAGVSILQALFIKEHNAVCDTLKREYRNLGDEELYRHARLVTSAVIAKVHTIDWTVELLKTDTLLAGMRGNWYGLLGKSFKDKFGHVGGAILGGVVGLKKPENHGVPYSLTEEFVSVYRMHSLLPDHLQLRDISAAPGSHKSPPSAEKIPMPSLIGRVGEKTSSGIGFVKLMVSMGHQASGALEPWNYPVWLRDVVAQDVEGMDRPDHVDLAALEVYRDRERNVARYNEFRRGLLMIPISKWGDLTDDQEVIEALQEVYGDEVEELDLLVGLMAEKKITGFAISETAFIIFLIMATRRLESDRFFTSNFNEETYTKKGFEWVKTTESLKDVLDRHYPEMTAKWMNSASAFSVWDSPPPSPNRIPLLFRVPKSLLQANTVSRDQAKMFRLAEMIKKLSGASLHRFIHQDFHEAVDRMTIIDAFLFLIVHSIDKLGIWHRLPVFLGLLYLSVRRHLHQEYNLFNVGRTPTGVRYNPADYPYRTADGKYNEPFNEGAGSQGTFFGRNILPVNQKAMLKKPDPMVVATKLLARKKFIDTGKQFNMIAASWIQFMIHDWIDHMEETQQIELVAPKEVANQCPLKSFKDGSAIYGSNEKRLHKVRTFKDGKLKISEDGLLLHDQDGIAVSGDVRNSWAGVSILQALFIKEHNAVCDTLKVWIAGEKFQGQVWSCWRSDLGRDISAAPGSNKSPPSAEKIPLPSLIGRVGEKTSSGIGFIKLMVSMGHQASGALEPWNYPMWLRDLVAQDVEGMDRPDHVDLAALEVYRDRERNVARYNEFRRGLLMIPISKWEDLTDDQEVIEALQEVYGDEVEELDILVDSCREENYRSQLARLLLSYS